MNEVGELIINEVRFSFLLVVYFYIKKFRGSADDGNSFLVCLLLYGGESVNVRKRHLWLNGYVIC